MQTRESDQAGTPYATLNFKTATGARQQIKRSLINFAPDGSPRGQSPVKADSADLSSDGGDLERAKSHELLKSQDELLEKPELAEKAFEEAYVATDENNN